LRAVRGDTERRGRVGSHAYFPRLLAKSADLERSTTSVSSEIRLPSYLSRMKTISLYEFGGSEDLVRRIQKRFVKLFQNASPVLDIGCGRGIFLELLTSVGIEGVGLDHSPESIAACKAKGFTVYCQEADEYLNQNPERFGGIFCSHVIEHMGYEDAMAFLELCYGAMRPGGKLVLVTPNPEDLSIIGEIFWLDPTHVRPYPRKLLERMVEAVGFRVITSEQFMGNWRMAGRRQLPGYLFRRLLLGRYFGRPNTMVLAEKVIAPQSS
jgi:2-polyprenyl-3-methyl-5-hydroxy-6-metoxy-1,4-benzoquinol methylase